MSTFVRSDMVVAIVIVKQRVRNSSKTFVKALKQHQVDTDH